MSEISYYDVLGLKPTCTIEEIQKKYREMVKKHHPDKGGNPELIELINKAYTILKDPQSRKEYDEIYKLKKQSLPGYKALKSQSQTFYKSQEQTSTPEAKAKARDEFKKHNEEMNKKMGYDPIEAKKSLDKDEFKTRFRDLESNRDQEEIEFAPEKIFEGRIDMAQFNAAFDKWKSSTEGGDGSLIPHSGAPMAYDGALIGNDMYSKYGAPQDEDDGVDSTPVYSAYNKDIKPAKLTKDDIRELQPASYTKGHNVKSDTYEKDLEQLIRVRNEETERLQKLPLSEYNTDSKMGGYGITDGVASSLKALESADLNDDDLDKKLDRLLKDR